MSSRSASAFARVGAADRPGQLVGADPLQVADDGLADVAAQVVDVSRIADHAADAVPPRDEEAGAPTGPNRSSW